MRTMCGVQLKDRKRAKYLLLMLGSNEAIDKLAMADSVCWYGHVLTGGDGHVLRRAFEFMVEGQRRKVRLKWTWKRLIGEESTKVYSSIEYAFFDQTSLLALTRLSFGCWDSDRP